MWFRGWTPRVDKVKKAENQRSLVGKGKGQGVCEVKRADSQGGGQGQECGYDLYVEGEEKVKEGRRNELGAAYEGGSRTEGGGTRRVFSIDHYCRFGVTAVHRPQRSWKKEQNNCSKAVSLLAVAPRWCNMFTYYSKVMPSVRSLTVFRVRWFK